jgi:hypothetical protein
MPTCGPGCPDHVYTTMLWKPRFAGSSNHEGQAPERTDKFQDG